MNYAKAEEMINCALVPLMNQGLRIEDMRLHVSRSSAISERESVQTPYGALQIYGDPFAPKGVAFIMEELKGEIKKRGFAWVSRTTLL